jgi:hypothetical protein
MRRLTYGYLFNGPVRLGTAKAEYSTRAVCPWLHCRLARSPIPYNHRSIRPIERSTARFTGNS